MGGAGVALALNPLVYWEWCRMAMFVGLWTDRTIVKHMLESPKNNSWAGLVKLVISTSLANYRVNQLVWHIPVKTCIQFLIWIVVNVVHFHWIDDAELFASSMTDGHCNWNNRGWLTLHICSIHYLKCLFMYSLYFITLQRSGKGPVTKPLCSIRPEHRGTFHTLFLTQPFPSALGHWQFLYSDISWYICCSVHQFPWRQALNIHHTAPFIMIMRSGKRNSRIHQDYQLPCNSSIFPIWLGFCFWFVSTKWFKTLTLSVPLAPYMRQWHRHRRWAHAGAGCNACFASFLLAGTVHPEKKHGNLREYV